MTPMKYRLKNGSMGTAILNKTHYELNLQDREQAVLLEIPFDMYDIFLATEIDKTYSPEMIAKMDKKIAKKHLSMLMSIISLLEERVNDF